MTEDLQPEKTEWIRSMLDQYEAPLMRYASRITGDVDRARDVVQETFLKLCEIDHASMNGRLAPWLYTVCRRKALDVFRKESRMQVVGDKNVQVEGSLDYDPARLAEQGEGKKSVLNSLTQLPQNQQEVIRLRFQSDLSYKEIANVMNLSVSNVGYLIHEAIKMMRKKLGIKSPTRKQ